MPSRVPWQITHSVVTSEVRSFRGLSDAFSDCLPEQYFFLDLTSYCLPSLHVLFCP